MPQTMLAILALMIALTFSNDATKRRIDFDRSNIRLEYAELGASIALRTIEVVRERPFDANLNAIGWFVDGEFMTHQSILSSVLTGLMAKSFPTSAGRGCQVFDASKPPCLDMNAFNAVDPFAMPYVIGSDTLWFSVGIELGYVDGDGLASSTPEMTKQVAVTVQDFWPDTGRKGVFIPTPIRLSRIVSLQM
jgi:hypothetical protein